MGDIVFLLIILGGLTILGNSLPKKRKRRNRQHRQQNKPDFIDTIINLIAGIVKKLSSSPPVKYQHSHYFVPPQPMPANDIEVVCLSCGNILIAPVDLAGQTATCEGCRSIVSVPGAALVTPPPSLPIPVKESISLKPTPKLTVSILKDLEWKRFEELTEAYFVLTGWTTKAARFGADGGVDIHLFKPDSQTAAAIVQCKAWNTYTVGVKPVRELFGVMAARSIKQGYFVTTGEYTKEAYVFAQDQKLTLIDGRLFIKRICALPDAEQASLYELAIAGDYKTPSCPRCGLKMVMRLSRKGRNAGSSFWGCPGYPRCSHTFIYKESKDR